MQVVVGSSARQPPFALGFNTQDAQRAGTMADPSAFEIPAHPARTYDRAGRLSYEGRTLFRLQPTGDEALDCRALVENVLNDGPYRHGDFHDLPMVVYLVRDEETGDVFRVSIRDGVIQLHVLPETRSAGLRQFYERLGAMSSCEWNVTCQVDAPGDC